MTKRESRVVNAFLGCIKHGDYTEDYAITLIEDQARYGWLTNEAKDYFYEQLEQLEEERQQAQSQEPELETPPEESQEEPTEETPYEDLPIGS